MLNVYLTDPLDATPRPDMRASIRTQLQGYFDKVASAIKHPPKEPPEQYAVSWVTAAPTMTPQDLLVYFTSVDYSVVSRFSGTIFDPIMVSHWGYTFIKRDKKPIVAASEVYVKIIDADILAKLAFHELMHNKLIMGNNMHDVKNGLGVKEVTPASVQTQQNVADMAAAAKNEIVQWTDGFAMMEAAKKRRDGGDFFWNR